MFKYNFHNLNYDFILRHILLIKTNNFENSCLKLQIQILIENSNTMFQNWNTIFRVQI
jgi:hypothetical protein